jgi:hypothetical protein
VARTLERAWEAALAAQRDLEEQYHRFQQEQPVRLSAAERAEIEALARDLPALWRAPTTTVVQKRQVVRSLLQRVVVWAPSSSQEVRVQLHWTGGTVTEHRIRRGVQRWEQMTDVAAVRERLQGWRAAGWTSRQMAEALNAEGHRTPHGRLFTAEGVRQLLARGGPSPASGPARADGQRPRSRAGVTSR